MPGSASPVSTPPQVRPWERFALGGLVVAVAAVMGVAALAREDDQSTAGVAVADADPLDAERARGVQELLDRWAAATVNGDEAAVVGLVDDAADPAFRDDQVNRARWASGVPFADFGYELTGESVVVPPQWTERFDGTELWAPTARFRHALAGADEQPTRKPVSLLVARRGADWLLVSDAPIPGTDRETWRGPWDHGPVTVTTVQTAGGPSVVLAHPGDEPMRDALAREVGPAIDHVSRIWGDSWARRAVVVVTASHEEFSALVGPGHDGANIAAVAVSDAPVPGEVSPSGQRIVFGPTADERLGEHSRAGVLRHELTHIAARAATVDGSPMWMLEGYAEYVAHRDEERPARVLAPELAARFASDDLPGALPSDADFAGDSAAVAYETAWSVCAYVADRYGERVLTDLYRALATGARTDAEVDEVVRTRLGVGVAALVEDWARWVPGRFA